MKHDVIRQADADGREVVGVTLANATQRAWVYAEDYERVLAAMGEAAWYVVRNVRGRAYVRLRNPSTDTEETVARILTGRIQGSAVAYVDEDSFNLRRRNLYLVHGAGGRPKAARRVLLDRRAPDGAGQGIGFHR